MSLFKLCNSEGSITQNNFFNELLDKQQLTDVTLACDDGFQIRVHRTIIAASSLFFREVIMASNNPNPFIYLRGVNQETLQSLLSFIYVGETTVTSENMDNLVQVGHDLKIVGLAEMEESEKTKGTPNPRKEQKIKNRIKKENSKTIVKETKARIKKDIDLHSNLSDQIVNETQQDFDTDRDQSELAAEIEKRLSSRKDEHDKIIYFCTVCGKDNGRKHEVKLHIETHLEGFRHKCPFCRVSKTTRNALRQHTNLFCKFNPKANSR